MTGTWNRLRYTFWAPWYDMLLAAAGFEEARRRSIQRLALEPGDRVLLLGAGTGLDLDYLPSGVRITAVDLTPAMLRRLSQRARRLGLEVEACTMDARHLTFPDAMFDGVVLHLILTVMPEPHLGLSEVERVLKPGGRVAVFDKFLRDGTRPSVGRRFLNVLAKVPFSDINMQLEPLVRRTRLQVELDEPSAFGGFYRTVTLIRS